MGDKGMSMLFLGLVIGLIIGAGGTYFYLEGPPWK